MAGLAGSINCCVSFGLQGMIYYQHVHPDAVSAGQLDLYLSKGWYRIQQLLITTDLITKDNEFLAVFWLRYRMAAYTHSKKSKQLLKAIEPFTVSIEPLSFTIELSDLYSRYHSSLDFDMSDTLQGYLLGDRTTSVFDTKMICIRHEGRLIAAGCYDEGDTATMGIVNIYDPSYKKYSLGKVLVLLKLEEAMRQGKTFFYPGYISIHNTKFDYKLFPCIDATEVYNRLSDEWMPYADIDLHALHKEMLRRFFLAQNKDE